MSQFSGYEHRKSLVIFWVTGKLLRDPDQAEGCPNDLGRQPILLLGG